MNYFLMENQTLDIAVFILGYFDSSLSDLTALMVGFKFTLKYILNILYGFK
jgi:hypothetical protein